MDKHLTTTCCSSTSPSVVATDIEKKTTLRQAWCNGCCYSFDGSSSMSTSEKKMQKSSLSSSSSSTERIPLCGIIVSLVFLNFVFILRDFYSSFRFTISIFKFFLRIISFIWAASRSKATCSNNNSKKVANVAEIKRPRSDQTKTNDHRNLSLSELKMVIDTEGTMIFCNLESADEIAGLFVEDEPSLMEIKEAFDVFDENKDGFIDAKELRNSLSSLGFMEASEEDCKTMIKGFDDNLDGKIDFTEFIKVMEKSFC